MDSYNQMDKVINLISDLSQKASDSNIYLCKNSGRRSFASAASLSMFLERLERAAENIRDEANDFGTLDVASDCELAELLDMNIRRPE